MFNEFLTQRAPKYLSDGYGLTIAFANIDLSARGPSAEIANREGVFTWSGDPMFEFDWAITDRAGVILKKGSERLRPYAIGLVEAYGEALKKDPYYYDKARLDDWMRHNLRT